MTEDDEEKTGFYTEEGVYCFTHMPKELKNSAATLQRMMEKVLADQRGRNEGENSMLCLRSKKETICFVATGLDGRNPDTVPIKKLQAKSTPTPRARRLYLGIETIEEGSGVGIILVSPEENMYSYAIHLKFNASNHAIDCEALLVGLAASVRKDWKLLFFDVATTFDSAVYRVHAISFDAVVASPVSAACIDAAAYLVYAAPQSSCFEKIYLETWN
ncbi:hypothetical protein Tco_0128763 [Tanacetum coccineum]